MITGGDDVDAGGQDFARRFDGDAGPAGGVFAIGDDDVNMKRLAQAGQQFAQSVPSGFADNIADKKKIHKPEFTRRRACGKPAFLLKYIEFPLIYGSLNCHATDANKATLS